MAVVDPHREFLRLSQSAARHRGNGFAGYETELTINNPTVVRHIAMLAEWQGRKVFSYGGRANRAESKFHSSECGIFVGSSERADQWRIGNSMSATA